MNEAGGKAVIFNTITVSDGISMGTEGMKYSLVSREVIADSIETVVGCEGIDGFVAIGGCDKNMPGCLMAMARLNRPAVFVYGGTILPGHFEDKPVDIVSVFEAVGEHANRRMSDEDLARLEEVRHSRGRLLRRHVHGQHDGQRIEALGMSLPNSSAQAAISKEKENDCERAGVAVLNLIEARHSAARHHDEEGVRERDHGGHRAGRLDQCRAASARHGARGGREADDR